MPTRQPAQLDVLLMDALAQPAAARHEFLLEVCGSDAHLLGELQKLLQLHERAGEFLRRPAAAAFETLQGSIGDHQSQVGTSIGPYKLLEKVGEGGFGTVYLAEQREPMQRRVALKVIKLGMDTKQVIARFEAERQALAMMDHPNIARVLDGGATDAQSPLGAGRPYFVMELVKGVPITSYCDDHKVPLVERLALFADVCHAVQHAHQKGIIHRDLKPSNVLVSRHDDKPVVKVIDFGIAKAVAGRLTDKTLFTELRQMIGTPAYMSPEQAGLSDLDIDTRSDIYSLGVLLYELLTGTTPFDARDLHSSGYDEMRRIIREVEPPKPSTRVSEATKRRSDEGKKNDDSGADALRGAVASSLRRSDASSLRGSVASSLARSLRGELDWIVMKCLEKDRTRRYETSSALAADVQRHLVGEPVVAAPPSRLYRMSKTLRRHRTAASVASGFVVLIAAGLVTTGTLWQQAAQSRDAESDQRARAEAINTFLTEMLTAADPAKAKGAKLTIREALDKAANRVDEHPLKDQPLVEAEIRFTIGSTFVALGLYEQAEPQFRAAAALQTRELGDEHPDTLRTRAKLAGILFLNGDYAGTALLLEPLMNVQSRVLGPEHPDTLRSMSLLGFSLVMNDRFAEGEPLLRAAVAGFQRGKDHPETARHMDRLGDAYIYSSYPEKAEPLHRQALQINTQEFGDAHPATLYSLHCLASSLHNQNRLQAAEPVYRKALEGSLLILGPEHPSTLSLQGDLARVLSRQGRYAEAEAMHRECLARILRTGGPDDARTITTRRFLAGCLLRQQKYAEAEGLLKEALDEAVKKYGPEHGDTSIRLMCALSDVLAKQRKDEEAEQVARQVLEFQYRQQPRPNLFELEQSSSSLIEVLQRREGGEEASQVEQRLIEFWLAAANAPDASAATLNSASRHLLYPKSEKLRDAPRALEFALRANELSDHKNPEFLDTLALAYHRTDNTAKAIELQRLAISLLAADDSGRAEYEEQLVEFEAALESAGKP